MPDNARQSEVLEALITEQKRKEAEMQRAHEEVRKEHTKKKQKAEKKAKITAPVSGSGKK